MWAALADLSPLSFTTTNPDGTNITSTQGIAFVDDTSNMFNIPLDIAQPDQAGIADSLTNFTRAWEGILHTNGGALKAEKCFCYIVQWDYTGNYPKLLKRAPTNTNVIMVNSTTGLHHTLQQRGTHEAERTLGIRLCPSGNMTSEFTFLRNKARDFAKLLLRGRFTPRQVSVAYSSYFLPSLTYSLPTTTFTQSQCDSIQRPTTTSFLLSMGFN